MTVISNAQPSAAGASLEIRRDRPVGYVHHAMGTSYTAVPADSARIVGMATTARVAELMMSLNRQAEAQAAAQVLTVPLLSENDATREKALIEALTELRSKQSKVGSACCRNAEELEALLRMSDIDSLLRKEAAADAAAKLGLDIDALPDGQNPDVADWESHREFFKEIRELLEAYKGQWLERFNKLMADWVKLFGRITEIMSKLSSAIKGNDGDKLIVDFSELRAELATLSDELASGKYDLGGDFADEQQAKEFMEDLGVVGFVVEELFEDGVGTGKWRIRLDSKIISDIRDVFPDGRRTVDAATYNAYIAGKDALMEKIMQINRVLPDKHQQQVQWWNTLSKALSASVDSMTEADRAVTQNVGS